MDLNHLLANVKDEQTFLDFVKALKIDRQEEDQINKYGFAGRGEKGWENHNIADYLEAAVAWAEDSHFG